MIDLPAALLIIGAGIAAGTINAVVGSGSLITFPVLLFLGFPPLVANVSNTIGIVPGTISGTLGYRRELVGQRRRAKPLVIGAALGGLTGAGLLLALPASAFTRVVPVLILIACALVAIQPRLSRWVMERRAREGSAVHDDGGPVLILGVYLTGIYGGYFGAAQGVILIALLTILVDDDIQRLNGLKNLIAMFINSVAAIVFILVAPVAWLPALLLAIGSTIGGQLGAVVGRRMSPLALRLVIILVGTVVAIKLLIS